MNRTGEVRTAGVVPAPRAAAAAAAAPEATPLDWEGTVVADAALAKTAEGGVASRIGELGGVFGLLLAIGLAMVRAGGD